MENVNLIKAREAYGISQEVMAAALNYEGLDTYTRLEDNELYRPLPRNAAKIAAILEVEIDSIFPGIDQKEENN